MSLPVLHPVLGMEEEQGIHDHTPDDHSETTAPIAMKIQSIGPDCASHGRNSAIPPLGLKKTKSSAQEASMKMARHIMPIGSMSFIASLPSIRSRPRGDPCGRGYRLRRRAGRTLRSEGGRVEGW